MKIICIEGNYPNTANTKETGLVYFLKPESAILRGKLPFFIPDHSKQIIPRCNIVSKNLQAWKKYSEEICASLL